MAGRQEVKIVRTLMGKLPHGADLLEALTAVCKDEDVRLGRVSAIGAVTTARLAFYEQGERRYRFLEVEEPLEIASLGGNVSLKDGSPFVHAHVTLSDAKGRTHGGHLAPGTRVFACEFVIDVLEGPEFVRGHDETTGLPLWTDTP